MSNGNAAIALALGAGAGLGLYYLLRDDQAPNDDAGTTAPSAPIATTAPAATPTPCALRLDAKGLTADGAAIDVPTAVTRCQAAGRADLVIADDAPSAVYADLAAAFAAAGIPLREQRNRNGARRRARRSPRRRRPTGRNVRTGSKDEVATLATRAARLRAEASMRQGPARQEAAAKLARFVAKHSGARGNDDATIDFENNVVVNGTPRDMLKVAAWVERLARDSGRPVSASVETYDDPNDPDWAVCRIHGLGLDGA